MTEYERLLEISARAESGPLSEIVKGALAVLQPDQRKVVRNVPVLPLPYRDLNAFAGLDGDQRFIGYNQDVPFIIYRLLKHIYAVVHPERFTLTAAFQRFTAVGEYIASGGLTKLPRESTLWSPPFIAETDEGDLSGGALENSGASAAYFLEVWILLHEYFHILCGHLDTPQSDVLKVEIVTRDQVEIEVCPTSIEQEAEADEQAITSLLKADREGCRKFLPLLDILLSQMDLAHAIAHDQYGIGLATHPSPRERRRAVRAIYQQEFQSSAVSDWALDVAEAFDRVSVVRDAIRERFSRGDCEARLGDSSQEQRAQFFSSCGYALYDRKRFEEARDAWLTQLELSPTDPKVPYNLACVSALLGEKSEMIRYLIATWRLPDSEQLRAKAASDSDFLRYRNDLEFIEATR